MPPSSGSSNAAVVSAVVLGAALLFGGGGIGAYFLLSGDDSGKSAASPNTTTSGAAAAPVAPAAPSLPPLSEAGVTPSPTTTELKRVLVTGTFFATPVRTKGMTFTKIASWRNTCTSGLKPNLVALLRKVPCQGMLYGAQYKGPNSTYVQLTLLEFKDKKAAERVLGRVNATTAPVIKVSSGGEPGHWWSSGQVGDHVLIRQSFVGGSRDPGPRNGPAEANGRALMGMMLGELNAAYIWAD